jgi:hypothetical protein
LRIAPGWRWARKGRTVPPTSRQRLPVGDL